MAGVGEKARYYLEQSATQLREFESKSIFNPTEIRSLVRKRTDFEHLVLSPGSKPSDWLSYARWEKSLETLRAKRCRRMQIRSSSSHAGEGRVFGILERAVTKHPGSVELWKEYLNFTRDVKATKRWRKVMSRALRMHPNKSELWVLAGRRSAGNGDMQTARAFFMRATRFCTSDATVWIEYARCEMEWLARMEAKKDKKGAIEKALQEQVEHEDDEIRFDEEDSDEDVGEDGRMILPDQGSAGKKMAFDDNTAKKLEKNPALDGAIPMAIFGIAKKQSFFNAAAAEQFFDLFVEFANISSQPKMIQLVLDTMKELYPNDPATCSCFIRQPLIGVDINSATYPKALRETLGRLKEALNSTSNKQKLALKTEAWIKPTLTTENLNTGIRTVLEHTARTLPKP